MVAGRRGRRLSSAALVLVLAAGSAFAQQTESRIVGKIVDSSHAALPGVIVTVTSKDTGLTREAVTGADGSYTVTITVSDGTSMRGSDTFVVTVANVAAVLDPLASASASEGSAIQKTVAITDPGSEDTFSAQVEWGDGASDALPSVTSGFSISHSYADNGSYGVVVTVSDGVASGTAGFTATVTNSTPTLSLGAIAPPAFYHYDEVTASVRARLGDAAWEAAWEAGRNLSLDSLIP